MVYLICSIALEATSDSPGRRLPDAYKLVVAFHVGNLATPDLQNQFTSHAPEPQHFWHFGNDRYKAEHQLLL